jgi:hypothetical protein
MAAPINCSKVQEGKKKWKLNSKEALSNEKKEL